jgi:hypothetical protein
MSSDVLPGRIVCRHFHCAAARPFLPRSSLRNNDASFTDGAGRFARSTFAPPGNSHRPPLKPRKWPYFKPRSTGTAADAVAAPIPKRERRGGGVGNGAGAVTAPGGARPRSAPGAVAALCGVGIGTVTAGGARRAPRKHAEQ